MKVCDLLNEAKYIHDNLAIMCDSGWINFISDIPATITKEQFYELCKLSGFEKSWYRGNEEYGPRFYYMEEEDVIEELENRRRRQPSYTATMDWKKFVRYYMTSHRNDNDFED